MHPSGESQHCQICWRGQRAVWEFGDVNALLDLAIISGKGQRYRAPTGGWGPSLDSARSGDAGDTGGSSCAGLDSVPGDRVLEGVARLSQWAIGSCRVCRMSLDTQSFSTWKSCSGGTWGFGMCLWASAIPCDPEHLTSPPGAPSALPHPQGQPTPHSFDELLGTTMPFPWEKAILGAFSLPKPMRHRKQWCPSTPRTQDPTAERGETLLGGRLKNNLYGTHKRRSEFQEVAGKVKVPPKPWGTPEGSE